MPSGLADFVLSHEIKVEDQIHAQLWVCDLLRYAGLAKQRIFLFPGLVDGTFCVGIGRGAALKLDRKRGAEVSRLQALRFNPYIFNARNFRRHFLHTLQSILLVGIRNAGIPLEDHHVNDGFRLAKLILSRNVTASEQRKRKQTTPKNSSRLRHTNSHVFLPFAQNKSKRAAFFRQCSARRVFESLGALCMLTSGFGVQYDAQQSRVRTRPR